MAGRVRDRPARSAIVSMIEAAALHRQDAGEGAERHGEIERQVDQHALDAVHRAGGEADQRIAHMADRGIGHQPLDVGLADGGEGAERHRGDGDEDDDLLPLRQDGGEGDDDGPHQHAHRRHLGRRGEEGRHRRRRALIDVRRPHVERHGRDLEGEAGDQEDEAEDQPDRGHGRAIDGGDAGEGDGAGEAVDQRGAIEQHAGGQRAEDEIFQPRLGRAGVVAVDGGDDIGASDCSSSPR